MVVACIFCYMLQQVCLECIKDEYDAFMRLLPNTASYLKKKYCHTFASTIKSDSFRILKPLAVFFTAESPAHRMMLDWNKYLLS